MSRKCSDYQPLTLKEDKLELLDEIESESEAFESKPDVELVKLRDFTQKVQGKRELMYALQVKGK